MKRTIVVLAMIAVFAAMCLPALAQQSSVTGNLGGIVTDSTGAVVQGATVTLTGPIGVKAITSDAQGEFMFNLVVPGTYSVTVERAGFRKAELRSIEVFTNKTSSVRFSLEPGAVAEVVEVSASAITVDTASTAVSENLNDTLYSQVPMGRGVQGIFYAAAGVVSGGGTGVYNPSISGGSGLENTYIADGVNMTDGAFGGFGVYSITFGSLGSGINLSFVKEVQVKTAGFEPQYGSVTGGVVQIVTKSGSNAYHGGVSAFFGPQAFEAQRLQADDVAGKFNLVGKVQHQGAYDIAGEIGGYVPGFKDKLFFFGSFNPSWTTDYDRYTTLHGILPYPQLGAATDLKTTSYNYAAKLTWQINDKHQLESSIFGDPSRRPMGSWAYRRTYTNTTDEEMKYGNRNWSLRYSGTLSPTWILNGSMSWKSNYVNEIPRFPDLYQISDATGRGIQLYNSDGLAAGPLITTGQTGTFIRQGRGYMADAEGNGYSLSFDTQKIAHFGGEHTLSLGYHGEKDIYDGVRHRSGPRFLVPPAYAAAVGLDPAGTYYGDATFEMRLGSYNGALYAYDDPITNATIPCSMSTADPDYSANCAALGYELSTSYPIMNVPGLGYRRVRMLQNRGEFDVPTFNTSGKYHALYANDSWSPIKYLTINLGLRWEQWRMTGRNSTYLFNDNWSPRIGVSVDPWGNRKTKVYVNWGRYSYRTPLDMAIRALSNEQDLNGAYWKPVSAAADCAAAYAAGLPAGTTCGTSAVNGIVTINSDGTFPQPLLDAAHLGSLAGAAISESATPIAPGTKMMYLDEWTVGFERDLGHGVMFSARYIDRRMKRIVEDMAGLSPEAYNWGLLQQYFIGNVNATTDVFTNPQELTFTPTFDAAGDITNVPAACGSAYGTVVDTYGNPLAPGAGCVVGGPYANGYFPGDRRPDGIADGFVDPVRNYQAVEVEVNKGFSSGWQLRANYRYAKLKGNYEGAFRNDNGQSDPNISSLFDFTAGEFGMLGDQFKVGYLNTDRRHVINTLFSYTFDKYKIKGLTIGTGLNVLSGLPMNDLKAHPAYYNAGEIPVGGRGALGRSPLTAQIDFHTDYVFNVSEKHKIRVGADLFNIPNMKRWTAIDQNEDRSFGVPNADFKTLQTFQRPFYARFMVKWEF